MNEPIDDELRELVHAYRTIERPTAAARATTWAEIEARIAAEPVALPRRARASGPLTIMAMAAALLLCLGLAAGAVWRGTPATSTEASHHRADEPTPRLLDHPGVPSPLAPREQASDAPMLAAPDDNSSDPSSAAPDGESHDPSSAAPGDDAAFDDADRPSPARPRPRRRAQPGTSPSLRPEEVASFQRAQTALAEGDSEAALRALDEHGRRYPGGFFQEERLVSRAAALCKLGRVSESRATRDRFLRDRPASHLRERMRQTCREIE